MGPDVRRVNRDTPFFTIPEKVKTTRPASRENLHMVYVNPFRKAIKALRAGGARKQARVLARAARDAAREVHLRERAIRRQMDALTKAQESGKVE